MGNANSTSLGSHLRLCIVSNMLDLIDILFLGLNEFENCITHAENLNVIILIELFTEVQALAFAFQINSEHLQILVHDFLVLLETIDNRVTAHCNIRVSICNHHI